MAKAGDYETRQCEDGLRIYSGLVDLPKNFDSLDADGQRAARASVERARVRVQQLQTDLQGSQRRAEEKQRPLAAELEAAQSALDECNQRVEGERKATEERAQRELQQRADLASTRPILEIIEIPRAARLPEEAARLTVERAKRKADKKWPRPLFSALICVAQAQRTAALNDIAEEKKYAKIGGVANMAKLYSLQEDLREADGELAKNRQALQEHNLTPLPCKDRLVGLLALCRVAGMDTPGGCDPAAREYLGLSLEDGTD